MRRRSIGGEHAAGPLPPETHARQLLGLDDEGRAGGQHEAEAEDNESLDLAAPGVAAPAEHAHGALTGRRVWAEGLGPDGICTDADSAIWVQTADTAAATEIPNAPAGACVRVLDGGEITHRVETELPCFACALGGPVGRHLFLLCNEFEGVDQLKAVQARRSARILVPEAPVSRPS